MAAMPASHPSACKRAGPLPNSLYHRHARPPFLLQRRVPAPVCSSLPPHGLERSSEASCSNVSRSSSSMQVWGAEARRPAGVGAPNPGVAEPCSPSCSKDHGAGWRSYVPDFLLRKEYMVLGFAASFGMDLSKPSSVAQSVAVLAAIVAVHESGHFLAARLQKIKVTRFAVGFGPTIFKWQGKEVEYCLNAVPLGGYVAFPDDDPKGTIDPDDPDLLKNRSIAERALVISAGVIANFIFAYSVLFTQVATIGKAETDFMAGVRVPEVLETSTAGRAGFRNGDIILKIGDFDIPAAPSQISNAVGLIRANPGKELAFTVDRAGSKLEVMCTPDLSSDGIGRIGVQLQSNTFIKHTMASSPAEVLQMTQSEFMRLSGTVFGGLQQLFTNFAKASGQLSGPIAIVAAGSDILRTDAAGVFQFCAIVNINLAAVNLLPLPALDGFYLLLLALEAARGGQKLDRGLEAAAMASGFLFLCAVGGWLIVRDTINLL